jgi:DNA-binding NarL/FixJ family response regulator
MNTALIDNEKISRTIRILIVDDEPVFAQGLRQILGAAFPAAIFGQAEDSTRTIDLLREQSWDVVLLVCGSSGNNGLALRQKIKRASPRTPALVVGSHPESECARCAIRAGASGCVTKKLLLKNWPTRSAR